MSPLLGSLLAALAIIAPARPAAATQVVSVGQSVVGRVRPGFLGLSMEIRGVEAYTGFDSNQVDPVFEQLIRQLDPGQHPVLRIGGDTTDWTWYPIRGVGHPFGVRYALTPTWFKVVKSLARGTNARLILGVNLEADRTRVAAAEANAMITRIGRPWLQALQLGNEPDLYNIQASYTINGAPFFARGSGWGFGPYLSDYARISRAMSRLPARRPRSRPAAVDERGRPLPVVRAACADRDPAPVRARVRTVEAGHDPEPLLRHLHARLPVDAALWNRGRRTPTDSRSASTR